MKDCPESEILAAWLEDGLGPTERAAVRRHLADCDDCRRSVALAGTLGPAPAGAAP
ncbi:MAG TPA: zf-HC2 domain-containing protein, partial [Planctomycetota bacterium]|nr:zf-HC2 domain-containing protein [Planctomycetota bacterium]